MSYIVLCLFALGILVGRFFRDRKKLRKNVDMAVTWSVYLLLFLLGVSVGINEKVLANFSQIGYKAFWITIGAVGGSLILAKIVYVLWFNIEKGNKNIE